MNDYNKDWLKNRGFFEREKREILDNKEIFIDLDNNIVYLEVKNNDELENLKRLVIKNYPETLYIWFYFPEEKKIKVFRRHGIELMWFWFKPEMNKESLKSRMDKLNKLSPSNIDVLFDTRDIADKFYWQLWEIRIKLAKRIKDLKEDYSRLMVVQHFIDRLIFFYFISQMGLIRIKHENKETRLSRRYTREFIRWLKNNLSDIELYQFFSEIFFDVLGKVDESGWSYKKTKIGNHEFEIVAPSLNGGLFVENEFENKKEREIKIRGIGELIDILNKYNWIIGEEIPEEEDVIGELTPEIIGHIYEKFVVSLGEIDIRKLKLDEFQQIKEELRYGRKKIGAYYTPEEITNYISKNTIYPYLRDRMKEKFGEKGKKLISDKDNDIFKRDDFDKDEIEIIKYLYFDVLSKIKICDNACGSGSFLIAAGKFLLKLYSRVIKILERYAKNDEKVQALIDEIKKNPNRNYYIVKKIITNNLYGVDIMDGAIEIAKLRFWLWLVSQVDPNEIENKKIETLPNLDFNLMVGNSLIGFVDIEDVEFDFIPVKPKERWETLVSKQYLITSWIDKDKVKWLKDLAKKKQEFKTLPAHEAIKLKEKLNNEFERARKFLNEKFLRLLKSRGIEISKEEFLKLKPFHWGFEFYEVFDLEKPKEERGFDIIIGNPPYGEILSDKEYEIIKNTYYFKTSVTDNNGRGSKNAASIFIERSYYLLSKRGKFGYIVPHSISRVDEFQKIRKLLINNTFLYRVTDAGNPFIGVTLEMIIIFFSKELSTNYTIYVNSFRDGSKRTINKDVFKRNDYFVLYYDEIFKKLEKKGSFILDGERGEDISVKKLPKNKVKDSLWFIRGKNIQRYYLQHINGYDTYIQKRNLQKFDKLPNEILCITQFGTNLKSAILNKNNEYPSGGCIIIKCDESIKKLVMLSLNSSLLNYYIQTYIFNKASLTVHMDGIYLRKLPIVLPSNKKPFEHLCNYMLFLNNNENRRNSEALLIEFLDKQLIDSLVYELYFKEKFEEDGLKTNLIELVEPYLEDIEKLKTEEEKLKTIKQVVEKIRNDSKVMKEIEKIKSHPWIKIIEGNGNESQN